MAAKQNPSDAPSPANQSEASRLAEIFSGMLRVYMTNLSHQLARDSVSFPQYFLLTFLSQHESVTMTEIARWMGHTTAAATGMIDRLESLGLAKRSRSKDDRRKIGVKISSKGQKLVDSVKASIEKEVDHLLAQLDREEAAMWLRIYEKIEPHYK